MKTWLIVSILLSAYAGMKFSDLMNYKIAEQLRKQIALQEQIIETKSETIDYKTQTIGYCSENISMCVSLLVQCEDQQ